MSEHQRVHDAINAIKRGQMVIMVDDEDRENEGDLVYAATFSTPEHVNFMATHAKGLICVALDTKTAHKLELTPMVSANTSAHETAFTVSVDAKEATTGISAAERDMTIKILSNPISRADELVKPGHIFPLIAKEGGTIERTGHTEGSVDLCRLAGVSSVSVICEIMKEDGTMARRDDLKTFAKTHDLIMVSIADIVAYRLANETLITPLDERRQKLFGIDVMVHTFKDYEDAVHTAVVFHAAQPFCNVKVHEVIDDIDLLLDDEKYEMMMRSIEYLKINSGILLFMKRPKHAKDEVFKDYGIGAQILKALGVEKMRLLSSSKQHGFVGIKGFGLSIEEVIEL